MGHAFSLSPIQSSERYTTLDLARGFALFGVLLINLLYFFRLSLFDHFFQFHSHPGRLNHAIDLFAAEFLEFKAFDLFSLTFGIGVAVQAERALLRGVTIELFLVRRFLFLLAFGALHMVLVSNVDILCLYALCGLLLIPLRRLPTLALGLTGVAAICLPSVFSSFTSLPGEAVIRAHAIEATRMYSLGSFGDILTFRWHETKLLIFPLLIGVAQKSLGLMLLGVAVWRAGLIRQAERYRRPLWIMCIVGTVIGLSLRTHIPLALAYFAAILAWRRSNRAAALTAPIAAAGRMAFTNYLTQSLLFALLFYGFGFGLFGRLDPATAAAIGMVVYAGQLWLSSWWLHRYRFGPFEWLWRSLTYARLQPMRLARHNPVLT